MRVSADDLLEAVPDAVVGVDREGIIAFVNTQAERMFGYERREMLGQPVELLLPDHLKTVHIRHREGYHANPATRPMGVGLNLLARRKDGRELPMEISLSPLKTQTGIQVISAIRDVTYRRAWHSPGGAGAIFEKFRTMRGDATGDTGLGLPFCKLAIERMGGRIALTSAPGVGTTFAVTLPSSS